MTPKLIVCYNYEDNWANPSIIWSIYCSLTNSQNNTNNDLKTIKLKINNLPYKNIDKIVPINLYSMWLSYTYEIASNILYIDI